MRILVGMSGGIDSTYAALKLIREGHSVTGAVLRMHPYTETAAAEQSCRDLGIPIIVKDVEALFNERVIPNFISEYKKGRTPNPCIICNSDVKFRALLDLADELGFDMIATGHYAKVARLGEGDEQRWAISRAADLAKDQSYMLWRLPEEILCRLILPLGDMTKEQIRTEARLLGIAAADRADSQEICFIPDGDYASYIENRVGVCPEGDFVDRDGRVIARHKGIIRYTVGQRKGLGVAAGARIFVTDIDPETNRIRLEHEMPECRTFVLSDVHYSGIAPLREGEVLSAYVKIRYQAPLRRCAVRALAGGEVEVTLEEGARAIAKGQSAVFYIEGSIVLGGFINSIADPSHV